VLTIFLQCLLPQLKEVAGKKADELIKTHIMESDYHKWLDNTQEKSKVLGLSKEKANEH